MNNDFAVAIDTNSNNKYICVICQEVEYFSAANVIFDETEKLFNPDSENYTIVLNCQKDLGTLLLKISKGSSFDDELCRNVVLVNSKYPKLSEYFNKKSQE